MEDLTQFENYEVKYKDAVYTINVFDLENNQNINAKASTLNLAIQEIMEKYKDLQEPDNIYLIRKKELEILNKGRLEYKILYQRTIECHPNTIYSTAATLTFTSTGIVVTGHIGSYGDSSTILTRDSVAIGDSSTSEAFARDSKNLERQLYEMIYKQIIPSHKRKG